MVERIRHLKDFRVCRFCLDDAGPFTNIYEKDSRDGKQQIPLPLQIMACIAIEVFSNDGMPQLICNPCRSQTIGAYNFKTTCKKADDTLKLYLATGNRKLVRPLHKRRASAKNAIINEYIDTLHTSTLTPPQLKQKPHSSPSVASLKRPSQPSNLAPPVKRPLPIPTIHSIHSDDEHPDTETIHITMETDPLAGESNMEGEEILPTAPNSANDANRFNERERGNRDGRNAQMEQMMPEEGNSTEEGDTEDEAAVGGGEGRLYDEYEDDEEEDDGKLTTKSQHQSISGSVYPCTVCERTFPLTQQLDLHMKNHERIRNFSCNHDGCGRMFFNKYDLAKHTQTHFDYKPFTCVVCKKSFSRESLLHRHEKVHVNVSKYLCTHCDRTFLNRDDYDTHREKHKKRRPFQCRICNKSFVFKQGLERHEVAHADEKPHKCNYCEASFTSPIKLMRHITSHAGLRPYPCKICGRTFLLSHHLTRHLKSHYALPGGPGSDPPVGQHKCDVCSMSFRRKDSLINHSAIHSMVNLRCVICNTAFENAKQVKHHITSHLSGLPYPCDKCDYSFDTQDQLEEHELKHAAMEYEEQIEAEVSKEALDNDYGEDEGEEGEDAPVEMGESVEKTGEASFTVMDRFYKEEEEYDDEDEGDMTEFTITESGLVPLQRNKKKRRSLTASINLSTSSTNQLRPQTLSQLQFAPQNIHPESDLDSQLVEHHLISPPLAQHVSLDIAHVQQQLHMAEHAQHHEDEQIQQDHNDSVDQAMLDCDEELRDDKRTVADEIRNLQMKNDAKMEAGKLKPIVRSEGTKVYARKASAQKFKPQMMQPPAATMAPLSQINQSTLDTLGLTQQDVNSMPTKKYVDMKVGDKTVRVQKLIMTKAEIAAMAKEGKIEMKGGNIILKKTKGPLTPSKTSVSGNKPTRISLENILDHAPKVSTLNRQRFLTKKTYVKKSTSMTAVNRDLTITPVMTTTNVNKFTSEVEQMNISGESQQQQQQQQQQAPEHSIEEVNI